MWGGGRGREKEECNLSQTYLQKGIEHYVVQGFRRVSERVRMPCATECDVLSINLLELD